ncbi:ABC transporter permease [Rhodocytophaga rosea]|uniref:ABC transporter permease n=1 Tax=Rhodocytophaga rosea TaxID=2704465 RepID=A0A6C0GGJ8_9BACT|nr:ABC transporter permease [Rhodocytophaga rosea]QHT67039.1 ABC transporter permease [Rhodocytophaga rosea]
MIHNYLIIAWRNIRKNKVFSFINMMGLAIGMAACLLILEYIIFETSYDQFHSKGGQIYRVITQPEESETYVATANAPLGPSLKAEFPEVANYTRFLYTGGVVTITQHQTGKLASYHEDKLAYVDSTFLDMFSYSLAANTGTGVLQQPNMAVLSQAFAKKYFGSVQATGKVITLYDQFGKHECTVTGVLSNIPQNSHLQFDALFSMATLSKTDQFWAKLDNWNWTSFYTYVQLANNAIPQQMANKFPALIQKYGGSEKSKLALQRMPGIHLYSDLQAEASTNGNIKLVYFLTTIAFFILLIAWINYINLSTARAIDRAKEVGIRKVSGSTQWQLIIQFMYEALFLNIIAIILSLTIVQLSQPLFNELTGKPLTILLLRTHFVWAAILLIFMAGAGVSGLYPAFILSSFRPAVVLKGRLTGSFKGAFLRKSLVTFQFAASVALIIGTFTVYSQLDYMRNKDLGMNISHLLVIKAPVIQGEELKFVENVEVYKNDMKQYPAVQAITASQTIPGIGYNWYSSGFRRQSDPENPANKYNVFYINNDFLETYQIQLLAGRNFSPARNTDGADKEVIINQTALKQLGFASNQDAINQYLYNGENKEGRIVGVVQDYHHESLKTNLEAIIIFPSNWANYFTLRINSSDTPAQTLAEVISKAKQKYDVLFPGNPFEYFFLDEFFNQKYQTDQQFGKVFSLFAALAILVACLGLFGLASFTISQRTKEIGIRKVLGASVSSILILLSKDFVRLVLLANVIAWPLAYMGMHWWLQNYPFRIGLSWWLFIIPALFILCIALLTISLQTIRTARSNPIQSLRYE